MGASLVYLEKPATEKENETGSNHYLEYAMGAMQGWRLNMVSYPTFQIVFILGEDTGSTIPSHR